MSAGRSRWRAIGSGALGGRGHVPAHRLAGTRQPTRRCVRTWAMHATAMAMQTLWLRMVYCRRKATGALLALALSRGSFAGLEAAQAQALATGRTPYPAPNSPISPPASALHRYSTQTQPPTIWQLMSLQRCTERHAGPSAAQRLPPACHPIRLLAVH